MTAFCLPTDTVDVLQPVADVVLGNITDAGPVRAAMPQGLDAIFHAAGDTSTWSRHAARQHTINVVGTTNVIEAALQRSAARFIYTSSISAYGYQPGVRISEGTRSNVMTKGDNYGRTNRGPSHTGPGCSSRSAGRQASHGLLCTSFVFAHQLPSPSVFPAPTRASPTRSRA